jgi:hypothetical protein
MKNSSYLPSKKLSLFLLIILLIAIFLFFKKNKTDSTTNISIIKNTTVSNLVSADKDLDGLYDWEESLWGTDPEKKDSDSDGVSDKEETELKKKELGISSTVESNSTSQTDQLAKEIFSLAISLNQNGLLTEEGIENLTKILGDQIYQTEEIEDPTKNITLNTIESTPQNKETYKKEILKTIENSKNNGFGEELKEFSKIITEENQDNTSLQKISQSYSELADALIKIKTPEEISDVHKSLISETIRTGSSIQLMSNYYSDPILSLRGVILYKKYSDNLEKNLYSLLAYFK